MRHHDSYGTVITFEPAMIIGIEYWSAVMRMSRQPPRDHRSASRCLRVSSWQPLSL